MVEKSSAEAKVIVSRAAAYLHICLLARMRKHRVQYDGSIILKSPQILHASLAWSRSAVPQFRSTKDHVNYGNIDKWMIILSGEV